jgi:hypothetical protein
MTDNLLWYFCGLDRKLRYGDERIAKVGITHTVAGIPKLCAHGLHASASALDALRLGGGPVVFQVELGADAVQDTDKAVSTSRRYVAGGIDVTKTLVEFACCIAEASMLLTEHYDERSWNAIEVTRAIMRGELNAAAAYAAANANADAAAAYAAAANAAADAANAAAYAAANAANANADARTEINALLESMLIEAINGQA